MGGTEIKEGLLQFHERPNPGRKTKVWTVYTKISIDALGAVIWFTRWRKYTYESNHDIVYDENCLREIADFIEQQTKEHKRKK